MFFMRLCKQSIRWKDVFEHILPHMTFETCRRHDETNLKH